MLNWEELQPCMYARKVDLSIEGALDDASKHLFCKDIQGECYFFAQQKAGLGFKPCVVARELEEVALYKQRRFSSSCEGE